MALGPHDQRRATPLLGLRAGALAAQRGLVLSPVTADNLGRHAPPLPIPWPDGPGEALLEHAVRPARNLVPVWEALDLAGCIVRWIPGWDAHPGPAAAQPDPPAHRRPALGADASSRRSGT